MAIFSLILGNLAAAGFTGAVTVFGLSPGLSAALLSIGKSVLWNEVSKALAPKVPAQHVQAVIAQAAGPRVRAYGEFLLGGTRALFEAKGGTLHQIIVMHHGEVSEVLGYLVDGEAVTLDGAGHVTAGAAEGYLRLTHILTGDGGDYSDARAAFPTIWTDDHRLTGLATIYARMKAPGLSKLQKVFPRQHNTEIQARVRGATVIDPRTMALGFSDLTGPVAMDYLTHPDGYRIPLAALDLDSFAQFTDLCDQDVPLKSGGTEKRYRVGGHYTLEDAPKDVMQRILATADAQIYMTPEGKAGIMGGEWLDPDVTITARDILSLSLSDGFDEFTDFNVLKGKFTSPRHRYQEAECAELVDAVSLETQPERVETYTVDLCPSHTQMQRLLKAWRAGQIREFRCTIRTNLVGMKARFPRGRGKHVIRIVHEEFGLDMPFEVLSHAYSVAEKYCDITVASITNPYGWTPATDEGAAPPDLDDLPVSTDPVAPPTGLTLAQEVLALDAAQNAVRLTASVNDPGNSALQLRLQYRVTGSTTWQSMIVGDGDLRGYSPTVASGQTYEVRPGWQGYDEFSAAQTITAVANPVAPAVPTAFSASTAAGTVTLHWTNGIAGYFRTRVYRGPTTDINDASLLATLAGAAGAAASTTDTPGTGTWSYWTVSINASLVESAAVGPQTVTI